MPKTTAKKKTKTTTPPRGARSSQPAYRLRRSPVHGMGVFATREIVKGENIIEYAGQRISHDEADRRHADKAIDDNHTFLFTIDAKTVIDAGVDGNDARFINHSCDPNCEVMIVDGRPIVEALRTLRPGEELAYDYNLTRGEDDPPEVERIFACRCGAATCRGTMLAPPKKRKPEPKPRATRSSGKTKPRAKAIPKAKTRKTAPKVGGKKRAAA